MRSNEATIMSISKREIVICNTPSASNNDIVLEATVPHHKELFVIQPSDPAFEHLLNYRNKRFDTIMVCLKDSSSYH